MSKQWNANRVALAMVTLLAAAPAQAQLTDQTQTPNVERAGIFKSLSEQIGSGVGDWATPGSSSYIIPRDPARSIRRGRQLFQRKFTLAQGFGRELKMALGTFMPSGRLAPA